MTELDLVTHKPLERVFDRLPDACKTRKVACPRVRVQDGKYLIVGLHTGQELFGRLHELVARVPMLGHGGYDHTISIGRGGEHLPVDGEIFNVRRVDRGVSVELRADMRGMHRDRMGRVVRVVQLGGAERDRGLRRRIGVGRGEGGIVFGRLGKGLCRELNESAYEGRGRASSRSLRSRDRVGRTRTLRSRDRVGRTRRLRSRDRTSSSRTRTLRSRGWLLGYLRRLGAAPGGAVFVCSGREGSQGGSGLMRGTVPVVSGGGLTAAIPPVGHLGRSEEKIST